MIKGNLIGLYHDYVSKNRDVT